MIAMLSTSRSAAAAAGASSTNEPGGYTQVASRSFLALDEDSWLNTGAASPPTSGYSIQTAAGPEGDNSVGQMWYNTGFVAGSGPANAYKNIAGSRTKLFIRITGFRFSTGWYGPESGINKIFFIWHGSGPNLYLQCVGGGSGSPAAADNTVPLYFRLNTQVPTTQPDFSFGDTSNGGITTECVRGTFYDIEILCEESSGAGVKDGRVRLWVKQSANSTWIAVADSNIEIPNIVPGDPGLIYWDAAGQHFFDGEQRFNPTWGGLSTWNVPAPGQYQQIDKIYMSAA